MTSLSSGMRVGAALALLLFWLVELSYFLALAVSPSFHPLAVHGALALLAGLAGPSGCATRARPLPSSHSAASSQRRV